jgi:hypothetical protein
MEGLAAFLQLPILVAVVVEPGPLTKRQLPLVELEAPES